MKFRFVKKWAQRILREDIAEKNKTIREERRNLRGAMSEIDRLKQRLFGSRKVLVSQTMLECIVKMLPDPNRVGTGGITAGELSMRTESFQDYLNGQKFTHNIRFVHVLADEENKQNIAGLTLLVSEYNLKIFIPLRRENVSYEAFGVQSAIDTYFWDFYGAGIRMLSDEAWQLSTEFIRAQSSVMRELKQEGLM